jgi:hypothetical protein
MTTTPAPRRTRRRKTATHTTQPTGVPVTTLPASVRWPPLPRALPRTVTAIQHETYGSYTARLAAANAVDLSVVHALAGYDESDPDCLARLAALSAQPPSVLLRAIPELRHHQDINTADLAEDGCPTPQTFINDIRPACHRCAAVAGAAPGTVSVWATHDRNVCLRHRLWIGAGVDHPDQQIELRSLPDIVHAQIRHRRLLRHRGRDQTREAFEVAEGWWHAITGQPGYTHHREARLAHAHATGIDPTGHARAALHHAVDYPEVVAFTALLASPYWKNVLNTRKPADYQRLHTELCRRVAARHYEHANPRLLSFLSRDLERSARQHTEIDPWPWPARWQRAMATQIQQETQDQTRRAR